jgi:hypothetical protein
MTDEQYQDLVERLVRIEGNTSALIGDGRVANQRITGLENRVSVLENRRSARTRKVVTRAAAKK